MRPDGNSMAERSAVGEEVICWLCNGEGDGWKETNKITFDRETAEHRMASKWWTVVPLVAPPVLETGEAEPKRWLLEEHLPGGSIRWHTFEHEHKCRARGIASEHRVTVTPLYASPPSLPEPDERLNAKVENYEEILRCVCSHLELPQSESGPADDIRVYDRALSAADEYTNKADADLAMNRDKRFAAEALAVRLAERGQAFANQVRHITHLLNGQAYSSTVSELNALDAALREARAALSAVKEAGE